MEQKKTRAQLETEAKEYHKQQQEKFAAGCEQEKAKIKVAFKHAKKCLDELRSGHYYADIIIDVGNAVDLLKQVKTHLKSALGKR